ncbi:transglutaminase-like putative cysteine protease [Gillisia mitskevichiae]|uniref:Transglutaminase-like putative cysteine protease n=1 Tax=Gillisia mitskevichiae TaxID=270921 RepID=A0A495Q0B8_9FLAO|nr:DUF3857 domain-containing protein [Gillisia mitskevichiae]RKS56139.1 transglutaminase-like putative cysteine protease [Gillisia mitskevichiae]
MRFKALVAIILFVNSPYIFCQDDSLSITNIPLELLENSNSVIRNESISIEIDDVDKMTIQTKRIVTVLNNSGDDQVSSLEFYNNNLTIKKQSAVVYNALGKEVKKYKQKDFKDVSAVSSNDLFTDNRVSYLDYTPTSYPYTILYNSEVVSKNTIFIQSWSPVDRTSQSVQETSYKLTNPKSIPLRIKETNIDSSIVNSGDKFNVKYSASNIAALKGEHLSPRIWDYIPKVKIALQDFALAGVKGSASNWQDLGQWQYDHLLVNKNELSPETIAEVRDLTMGVKEPMEKARLIYEYMQAKTRYISIQLGIGGWMPMNALEVDNLGYGDCKALTNYTYSLLESQGIKSYYTVVYAGEEKRDIDGEFASMQGNHVILTIPQENENIYLECTSQTAPFNYLGDFTDNRNVLLIKPSGGEIIKTKKYEFDENIQENSIELFLNANGDFEGDFKRISKGIQYGNTYGLERIAFKAQKIYYRKHLSYLKKLEIDSLTFLNSKKDKIFTEKMAIAGSNFGSVAGKRLLIPLSIVNVETEETPRYLDRNLPLEILRGKTIKNKTVLNIPAEYIVESIPENIELQNKFGSFKMEIKEENKKIIVNQTYILKDGLWEKEAYEDFRKFMIQLKTFSNQKAVIISN